MCKRFLLAITMYAGSLCPIKADCQWKEDPKIQNPNAATLNVFGEIPVNFFTGAPNISIPIHTLTYGKIKVPIALRYNPSLVRPTMQPGWVGFGWNLDCGGRITRSMRYMPDEAYNPDMPDGGLGNWDSYYPAPAHSTCGAEKANVTDWDAPARLIQYYTPASSVYNSRGTLFSDVLADEFTFNFGSHYGKFYYSGPQLGWQVVSNENLKVELYDFSTNNFFLNKYEIYGSGISQYHQFITNTVTLDQGWQTRLFKGFVITTGDGTKYIFGGPDAIEYNSPYGPPGQNNFNLFFADNWLLKKIVDINGNVVNFEYKRTYPTVNLFFDQKDYIYSATRSGGGICPSGQASFSNGTVNTYVHSGILQWPMYLTKITCLGETIDFQSSVDFDLQNMTATHLRYSNAQLGCWDERQTPTPTTPYLFDLHLLASNYNYPNDPANTNNIQWEKLDWILIKNSKQDIIKRYNFFYGSLPEPTKRLTLQSFTELNSTTTQRNEYYQFFYNAVGDLPGYIGNYTDHWGYFNNVDVQGKDLRQIIADGSKETSPSNVVKGLLTSVIYPTGGSVVLSWEPHDYSKVVADNHASLNDVTGVNYAGGCRISRIRNLSAEGAVLSDKKYYYKRNYFSGANLASLSSSGVLNGRPKYYQDINNRDNSDATASFNIDFVALHSLASYSFNANGSYIGYDEVVEVNSDGSYIRNFFTNYGTDINGIDHYDKIPSYVGWKSQDDPYIPLSSLELERGLPVAICKYNSNDILVQKRTTTYRTDQSRFNSFIKTIHFNGSYACAPGVTALIFASAPKVFNYVYYPVKTETTDYDANGKNPVVSTISLLYNSYNLISQEEEINSKGEKKITALKYSFDFPSDPTLTAMSNANILSPVVQTTTSVNNPTSTQLAVNKSSYYSPYTGIYVPSNLQVQKGSNPMETIQQFNQYDQKGNPLELQKPNDLKEVYVWGYDGQFPVAKISGSDYSTVYAYISTNPNSSQASRTIIDNTDLVYSDAQVRTELQKIRTALANTKAQVTTYTYDPVKGMTSQTDPNGKTIFYDYDDFGRLITVKDYNGNIIKTYDYQYKQ